MNRVPVSHETARTLNRRRLLGGLMVGAGLTLAGCTSATATPSPAPAQPTTAAKAPAAQPTAATKPTAAAKPTTAPAAAAKTAAPTAKPGPATNVKIGVIRGIAENLFLQVGANAGVFETYGIKPEFVEVPDSGTVTKAVIAREIQVGEITAGPLLAAISKDAPLLLVGASKAKLNIAMYVRPGITKLEDLYGKSIGTAAPGSFFHSLILSLFEAKGLDVSKVDIVNIGPSPAIFQAVANGKVDAGGATVEFLPNAMRDKNPEVLFYFNEVFPQYVRQGIGMHTALVREERDLALRVLKAWAASTRYGLDHKSEWVEQGARLYSRPAEDLAWYFDWEYQNRVPDPDLEFNQEMVDYMQRDNIKSGSQERVLPFDRVATLELQKQVVADLGKYQWRS